MTLMMMKLRHDNELQYDWLKEKISTISDNYKGL